MSPGGYQKRIQRLLRIIIEVKTRPNQSVPQLIESLNISKAQFYKDRVLLNELGFKFMYDRSQQKMILTADPYMPVQELTLSERLSLIMAFRQLSAAGDHILTYEGFKAARKMAAELPEKLRDSIFDDIVLREGFGCDKHILEQLQKAITDNQRISMAYQRPDLSDPETHEVDPYHLFFKRRALYMEGYSWTEQGVRMYRLNRIKQISFKFKGFSRQPGYDFGKRYKNAFSVFPGETAEHVTIRFGPAVRPYIEESMWHHSEKKTARPDGGLIFEVDVAYPREVLWWAFTWGPDAEILEPGWLREEARNGILKMMEMYS